MTNKCKSVWQYFERLEPKTKGSQHRAKCRYCPHEFNGQPARMAKHLQSRCVGCPIEVREALNAQEEYVTPAKKPCLESVLQLNNSGSHPHTPILQQMPHISSLPSTIASAPISMTTPSTTPMSTLHAMASESKPVNISNLHTPTSQHNNMAMNTHSLTHNQFHNQVQSQDNSVNETNLSQDRIEKELVDATIARTFYTTGIPFSVIENPSFMELLHALRPDYTPPSRKELATIFVEQDLWLCKETPANRSNGMINVRR
ncbi:hypothetical protein K7432_004670 [Basidiobolus ranarum]|uniref:BED-type domain-containing protein n=1 Tax=Basidiobolus ranarum TaxID=34480 RepID=A0ABR2WXS6_9FUNG